MARVTQVTVGGYWVNHYDNPCKQATTDYCDKLVTGFADAMKARGHRIDVLQSEHDASPFQWGAWTDKKPNGVDMDARHLQQRGRVLRVDHQARRKLVPCHAQHSGRHHASRRRPLALGGA